MIRNGAHTQLFMLDWAHTVEKDRCKTQQRNSQEGRGDPDENTRWNENSNQTISKN